ncbi:MAG: YciC family protein [Solirubrobacterales bacterium]
MSAPRKHSLAVGPVARDVASAYRAHWFFLVTMAVVVLLPQALADAFLDHLNVEGIHSARDVAIVAAVPLTVVVNLFGQAFYAGLAAAAVIEWRAHRPLPSFIPMLRSLPLGRLILLDLVITLGTAIGFVLLVIPGLVFMAYFSISPALVKFEHRGVWGSMRRSRELVRGNFWRVMLIVVGTILATEIAASLISEPFHGLAIVTVVDLAADGVLQPIEGLVIVVAALALLELRGEAPEQEEQLRAVGDID